jgi:predicted transcriptional regulator
VPDDNVGPILRDERESAGITRVDMAAAIGVSQSYLFDLEVGNRRWTNEVMAAYQKVLAEGVEV